ncbi:hypothetical protein CLPUN_26990 [Clostridium puniceum]|uniref:Uncharacterized protein n=1 Tax=Clostridium puniceum TaxID=29367 RepID=A0A1S8TF81_9CLOT|nr:hypothetical protein [Clostridium puniceum]OOM76467.1 hypothetical protein CLPUN_26990 [Clostridium puniceum]
MNFDNKKFGSIYRVAKFIGYSETEINNTRIMNDLYDGLSNIEEIIYHDLEFEVRISSGEPPVRRIYYMESLFTFYENYVSKEKLTNEIGLSSEQIYIIENSLNVKSVKLGERLNQIYFKGNNLSMICRHYNFSKFTDSFLILKATSLRISLTQEKITKFEEELNVIINVFLGQEFINSYFFFYYLHNILIRYKYPSNIYSDVLSKLVNAETIFCQELLKKYNKNLEITFYAIADKIFISRNDFIRMMELEKYRSVEEICNQLRLDKSEVFKSLFNIGYIDKYNSILIFNDKVKKTNLGLYIHSSLVEEIFFDNYFSDDQVDDLIAKNISLFNEKDIKYISYNSKNYIHVEAYKKLYYIIKASNDDYIYINEVLELKEVNSLIDVSKIRKSRFQQQLSKLIMPECLISYDYIRHKKLCRLPKVFSKAKVTKFFKELVKKEDLCSEFNISAENVELIIQKCDVKCYRFLKECISNLYNFKEFNSKMFISDDEKFVSIKVISKRFYGKSFVNNSFELNLANSIKKVGENIISFKKLEKPMFDIKDSCVVEYLYNLSEFEEFFNKLIPFDYVVDKLQIQAINLTLNLKKLKIEPVILGNATDKFIYKDLVKVIKTFVEANKKPLTYVEFAEKNNCVTLSSVEEKLKISKKISSQLIKNNKIKIICKYNGVYLINRENLEELIEEKQLFLDQMENVYITYTGIEKLYGKSFAKKIPKHNGAKGINLDKREIPLIAKDIYLKNNYIYRRDEVYRVWKKSHEYEELNSVTINDHFENFKNKVENVFKVNFTEKQQSSKKLWYEYVQHLLIKMNLCDKRRENHRINQLAYNTREIFSKFSDEIFNYSSQEINKIYLDDKSLVKVTYKQDFYSFLKSLYRSFLLKKKYPVFKIDKSRK